MRFSASTLPALLLAVVCLTVPTAPASIAPATPDAFAEPPAPRLVEVERDRFCILGYCF